MKRLLSLLMALLLVLTGLSLASCGKAEQPSDTTPEETTASPEPIVDPDIPLNICGNDLRDYTIIAYLPDDQFDTEARAEFKEEILGIFQSVFGFTPEYRIAKAVGDLIDPYSEHEILFTPRLFRKDLPKSNFYEAFYGVSEKGTIYFTGANPEFYLYLLRLFLEETMQIPLGSEQKCESCHVEPFHTEFTPSEDFLVKHGYASVFEDNFDGDSLNYDVWEDRGVGSRGCGYLAPSQVKVADGILTITGEYREDGQFGEGWYSSFLHLRQYYRRGYFESRIQCNDIISEDGMGDFWSAFWVQGPAPYTPELSLGGIGEGGAEIDIFEYFGGEKQSINFYCAGGADITSTELDSLHYMPEKPSHKYEEEYHKYALLWDESAYTIFIDDVPVVCTDFIFGTSNVPEEVILSICIPDSLSEARKEKPAEMKIDYLKIWQKPEQ